MRIRKGAMVVPMILALFAITRPCAAAPDDAQARYESLVADAQAGRPVDWQALRFAYADSPEFDLVGAKSNDLRKAMFAALGAGDYEAARLAARRVLDQDFADPDAHFIVSLASTKLGDPTAAAREQAIATGLWKSIETGDGKSADAAFTVISVSEEYSLMRIRQRKVTRQSLVNQGGHSYDVLETVGSGGDTQTFYFLIDRVMAAEAALFTPKH